MELRYFSGMAKVIIQFFSTLFSSLDEWLFTSIHQGLGPALVAEMSGLPWKGPKDLGFTKDQWYNEFKESGRPPFKQLPLLVSGP